MRYSYLEPAGGGGDIKAVAAAVSATGALGTAAAEVDEAVHAHSPGMTNSNKHFIGLLWKNSSWGV